MRNLSLALGLLFLSLQPYAFATDSTGTPPQTQVVGSLNAYFSANFPAFTCSASSSADGTCAGEFNMLASTTIINGFTTPLTTSPYLTIPTTGWYRIIVTYNIYNPSATPAFYKVNVYACQDTLGNCSVSPVLIASSEGVNTLTATESNTSGFISLGGGHLRFGDKSFTLTSIVQLNQNWTIPIYVTNGVAVNPALASRTNFSPQFIVPTSTYRPTTIVVTGGTFTIEQLP